MPTDLRILIFFSMPFFLWSIALCDVSHLVNNHNNQRHNQYSNAALNSPEITDEDHYHGQDGKYHSDNDGTGWDIRLSVPGEPEQDYPTLNSIPRTAFNCGEKKLGYYADTQTRCQVFRVCANTARTGYFSFLCPNGTLFNQEVHVCDWWMHVKCRDTEKYYNADNNQIDVPNDAQTMMANIKNMIEYPMKNPYKEILPPMNSVVQHYNPPADMLSPLQMKIGPSGGDLIGTYKLPGPPIAPINRNNGIPSGIASNSGAFTENFLNQNQGMKQINNENNDLFTLKNFQGLNVQNLSNENTQSIKITKQQFTYPSQYDKEYTLTVPKLPLSHPFVVRLPINIPAFDNSVSVKKESGNINSNSGAKTYSNHKSASSGTESSTITKFSKALPLIVLFLQPPLETHSLTNVHSNNHHKDESLNKNYTWLDSVKESTSNVNFMNGFTSNANRQSLNYNSTNQYFPKVTLFNSTRNSTLKNNDNVFTQNFISSKYHFQSSPNTNTEIKKDSLLSNVNGYNNNSFINITDFMTSLYKNSSGLSFNIGSDMNVTLNAQDNDNNKDLVTLFSAHIIPSGDINKQKVFKICIPKNILQYLVHLHNSTKTALQSSYLNELAILKNIRNDSVMANIQNQPFFKKIMSKMFKNYFSNQQVPIATGEEIYEKQKHFNKIENQKVLNENYEFLRQQNQGANYLSSTSFGQKQEKGFDSQNSREGKEISSNTETRKISNSNQYQFKSNEESFGQAANFKSQNQITSLNRAQFVKNESSIPFQQTNFFNGQDIQQVSYKNYSQNFLDDNQRQSSVDSKLLATQYYNVEGERKFENSSDRFQQKDNTEYNQFLNSRKVVNDSIQTSGIRTNVQQYQSMSQIAQKQSTENLQQFSQFNNNNRQEGSVYKQVQMVYPQNYREGQFISVQQHLPPNGIMRNENYNIQNQQNMRDFVKEGFLSSTNKELNRNNVQIHNTESVKQLQNVDEKLNTYHSNKIAANSLTNIQPMGFYRQVAENKQVSQPQPTVYPVYQVTNAVQNSVEKQHFQNNEVLNSEHRNYNLMQAQQRSENLNRQYSQPNFFMSNRMLSHQDNFQNMPQRGIQVTSAETALRNNKNEVSKSNQHASSQGERVHYSYVEPSSYMNQHHVTSMEIQNRNNYQTNVNSRLGYDRNNVEQPKSETVYTTVEVVPALGFALNTEEEKQEYFAALAKRLKNAGKEYETQHRHETVVYQTPTVVQRVQNVPNTEYEIYRDQRIYKDANNQYQGNYHEQRVSQFIPQKNVYHTQMVTVPHSTDNYASSQNVEELGYTIEKPSIPFTF